MENKKLTKVKQYEDAVSFLTGEAETLKAYASDEEAFKKYVVNNIGERAWNRKTYTLNVYLRNTHEHIIDQIERARQYDKEVSQIIVAVINAWFLAEHNYVRHSIPAQCYALANALDHCADLIDILKQEEEN